MTDVDRPLRVALAQIAGLDAADHLITTTGADAADLQRLRDAGLPITSV